MALYFFDLQIFYVFDIFLDKYQKLLELFDIENVFQRDLKKFQEMELQPYYFDYSPTNY